MTDEVAPAAPAAQAKINPKKKKPSGTKKPGSPPMSKLITEVVGSCKDRGGMSSQAVKKALAYKGVDTEKNNKRVNVVLTKMVANGGLVQVRGLGASGSYKLPKGEPAKAKKEKKEDKKKKPAAKKPAAKKAPLKKKKPTPKTPKKAAVKKGTAAKKPAKALAAKPKSAKPKAKKPAGKVGKKSSPVKKSADRKPSRAKGSKPGKRQAKGSRAKK